MALKISLRPQERIVIAGAVIRNGGKRCELIIENRVLILREKDILREEEVNTPCKRIYFAMQLMYLDPEKFDVHQGNYRSLAADVRTAAPSMKSYLDVIERHLAASDFYQALKSGRDLIEYEKEVLSRVQSYGCLQKG
jgi:flagellar protein FlbT